jgi:hypothetical protein
MPLSRFWGATPVPPPQALSPPVQRPPLPQRAPFQERPAGPSNAITVCGCSDARTLFGKGACRGQSRRRPGQGGMCSKATQHASAPTAPAATAAPAAPTPPLCAVALSASTATGAPTPCTAAASWQSASRRCSGRRQRRGGCAGEGRARTLAAEPALDQLWDGAPPLLQGLIPQGCEASSMSLPRPNLSCDCVAVWGGLGLGTDVRLHERAVGHSKPHLG